MKLRFLFCRLGHGLLILNLYNSNLNTGNCELVLCRLSLDEVIFVGGTSFPGLG